MPRLATAAHVAALVVLGDLVARMPRTSFGEAWIEGAPATVALAVAPEGPGRARLFVQLAFAGPRPTAPVVLPTSAEVGEVRVRAADGRPLPGLRRTAVAAGQRLDIPLVDGIAVLEVPVAVVEGHGLGHVGAPLPLWNAVRSGPRLGDVRVFPEEGTTAMGFQCGGTSAAYLCVPTRARSPELVVPLRRSPRGRGAWGFAASLTASLALLMTSLLRRGTRFFDRLHADDGRDDPLIVAGFLARALVSVLGFVGSIGLFAVFGDGRLPIVAWWALVAWTVAVAVGLAIALRTRAGHPVAFGWLVLAIVVVARGVPWVVPALLVAWLATLAQADGDPG